MQCQDIPLANEIISVFCVIYYENLFALLVTCCSLSYFIQSSHNFRQVELLTALITAPISPERFVVFPSIAQLFSFNNLSWQTYQSIGIFDCYL
jgi:hypothetical protein